MSFKCVIIDDQQYSINTLKGYIEQIPELSLHSTYNQPLEAMIAITSVLEIDFIFLDIEMPLINGLELAEIIRAKAKFLVFTTSHPSYALKAFDLKASQYLLKPFSFAKFATVVHDLIENANLYEQKKTYQQPTTQFKFVKGFGKNDFLSIDLKAIIFIAADRNYTEIHSVPPVKLYLLRMGINHMETELGNDDFIRINKSTIAARAHIRKVKGNTITLSDGSIFALGAVYRDDVLKFMNAHLLK
ncbi:MAG: LytTR family DNA-binding domain-containing protein [Bacteroidota bacterium]